MGSAPEPAIRREPATRFHQRGLCDLIHGSSLTKPATARETPPSGVPFEIQGALANKVFSGSISLGGWRLTWRSGWDEIGQQRRSSDATGALETAGSNSPLLRRSSSWDNDSTAESGGRCGL